MIAKWIFNLPRRQRIAIADAVFLDADSEVLRVEREVLRGKRQIGLNAIVIASLSALPAILSASIWETDSQVGARSLATAAIFFTGSFIGSSLGTFLAWFEPGLRRKAPQKRFIIGPDDQGDYEDQSAEHSQEEWVDENAHLGIPKAVAWRLTECAIWVALIVSATLFATGLLVGGIGVLEDLTK